jgi:hypothetical protein
MSTEPPGRPAPPPATPAHPPARGARKTSLMRYLLLGQSKSDELAVYHHSNLFYWWPVWFFGYIMAAITYFEDTRLAFVPGGTEAREKLAVILDGKELERNAFLLPEGKSFLTKTNAEGETVKIEPIYYVQHRRGLGVLYMVILIVVILITNVTMRGLWSFLVLIFLVGMAAVVTVGGWWDYILPRDGRVSAYIDMGGYLLLATVLFVFWLINFFVMDRQTYMIFTPGQVRLRLEIGGGETVYDTTGIVVQKQRGDLFRHWVLGLGSGDLLIRPAGLAEPIELTNVLHVGRVVRVIEQMTKEKVVFNSQSRT